MSFSPAEWMACAMAREIADGDTVAVGLATTLPFCGIMLARMTHAPNLKIAYVVPHGVMSQPRRASLLWNEKLSMERIEKLWSFTESVLEWIPREHPKEFFRPAQIDELGRTNNVQVGDVRLPGAAGIPDISLYHDNIYYYVPNHEPRVFVPYVQRVSGGNRRVKRIITNLAILDFGPWTIRALRPGVTSDEVRTKTGFSIAGTPHYFEPDPRHLKLLRTEIDPLGTRDLELLSGEERLAKIRQILDAELASTKVES